MDTIEIIGVVALILIVNGYVFGVDIRNGLRRRRLPLVSDEEFVEQMQRFGVFAQDALVKERIRLGREIRFPAKRLSADMYFSELESDFLGRFGGVQFEALEDRLGLLIERSGEDVPPPDTVGQYIANILRLEAELREH